MAARVSLSFPSLLFLSLLLSSLMHVFLPSPPLTQPQFFMQMRGRLDVRPPNCRFSCPHLNID